MTRSLARELGPDKIAINAIAPGWHAGTNLGNARREAMTPEQTRAMEEASDRVRHAAPLVSGVKQEGAARAINDPADNRRLVGSVIDADAAMVERMFAEAAAAQPAWDATPAGERAGEVGRRRVDGNDEVHLLRHRRGVGEIDEVASVVVMLATNSYITGQTLNVDGGNWMS